MSARRKAQVMTMTAWMLARGWSWRATTRSWVKVVGTTRMRVRDDGDRWSAVIGGYIIAQAATPDICALACEEVIG